MLGGKLYFFESISDVERKSYQEELRSIYNRLISRQNIDDSHTVYRFYLLYNTLLNQREVINESSCSSCVRRMVRELDVYFSNLDKQKSQNGTEENKQQSKPRKGRQKSKTDGTIEETKI